MNAPLASSSTTLSPGEPQAAPEILTGAQLVVRLLERQGITTVSGIPGGAILPFYDALSQSQQIRLWSSWPKA